MQQEGVNPNPVTFVSVLNACASVASLQEGKCAHKQIIEKGYDLDVFVSNSLVDMYAKCGSIADAEKVFNKITSRNVVSWTTMILGYVKCGQGQKALELFQQMQCERVVPNHVTFVGVLHACANISALKEGRHAHEQIIERGYESNIFVSNTLIDMYAKCGSIEDAWRVFSNIPARNVVSWNTMIGAYVRCGKGLQALELYGQMQHEGAIPNTVTFMAVLNACASVASLQVGRNVHKQIIERGYDSDVFVSNSLVNMYSKCGSIDDAERIFNALPTKNVVAWNAMIGGCVKCGKELQALELFGHMQQEGVDPDHVTFMAVLNACAGLAKLEEGRHAHEQMTEKGYGSDVVLSNCLIDMYSRCGSMVDAKRVFNEMSARNLVAWNAIIGGYVRCGKGHQALELFRQMELEGVDPDPLTFVTVLNACASVAMLKEGRRAHEKIIERGFESNIFLNNCLIDMYAKCGSIQEAENVLSKMPSIDVVGWTAMIQGYVKCGKGQEALELFEKMRHDGLEPDRVTFVAVLNACASVAALEEGRHAHEQVIDRGYESDVVVSNCLVDMYVKCGSIEDAQRLFNRMPTRDVVGWTAMLAGYASNGCVREAIKHFEQMCEVVKVDGITFISLLSGCSHGGLVDAGLEYFKSMTAVFNILPEVEHYACVVDLLGRAGRLQEAEDLVTSMPIEPDATVWMSLLAACRVHGNMEMGKHCAKRSLELDPDNAAGYALLSNVHAAAAAK